MKNVVVYKESGRFGGWPANHGAWAWGNELVIGFQTCYFKIIDNQHHAIDKERPRLHPLARSLDGGETWDIEFPEPERSISMTEPVDFEHPDLALQFRKCPEKDGSFYMMVSYDRCRTWRGPREALVFEDRRIDPRTDYIVESADSCSALLTAAKSNGKEGRVFYARTDDGGRSWRHVSWIGEERPGYSIMPSTLRLGTSELFTALRWQEEGRWGIDTFRSLDNGISWKFADTVVEEQGRSNPPSMIHLSDGRLCLTYGYRTKPYGIRAKLSEDEGQSWPREVILREDGGHWDLGYPRTIQRPDGSIVTTYYFCESADTERSIEATIWMA